LRFRILFLIVTFLLIILVAPGHSVAYQETKHPAPNLSGSADISHGNTNNALVSKDLETVIQLGHSSLVTSVAFSPDGKYALSGSDDKTLKLWEISSGREIRSFKGHSDDVESVAFSPDGKYALSGSGDSTLKLWEISSGREIRSFKGH